MRSELLLKGVNPGRLFSPRDITLRGILSKTKAADSHKLRALMAASAGDLDVANETYSKFIDAQWYSKVKEDRNESMFKEYYTQYKHLRPELSKTASGGLQVKGLN